MIFRAGGGSWQRCQRGLAAQKLPPHGDSSSSNGLDACCGRGLWNGPTGGLSIHVKPGNQDDWRGRLRRLYRCTGSSGGDLGLSYEQVANMSACPFLNHVCLYVLIDPLSPRFHYAGRPSTFIHIHIYLHVCVCLCMSRIYTQNVLYIA